MISKTIIDRLHTLSIEKYGGSHGIRDEGLLESAIAGPFQTFGGEDLYPDPFGKAAAICESIIINHPYIDGNKRTGFLAMYALLDMHKLVLIADELIAYEVMIKVSTGAMDCMGLKEWLEKNTFVQMGG